ncbi:MAG: hypothetical protein LIO79_06475 [Rikenellaceae bacterium]|nr:hypothetical protein [Rikenellaceae bacterium]
MKDIKKTLSAELAEIIKQNIPAGESMVDFLSNLLSIKKESVSRRLKGKVLFSFQEIALISHNLGISIDDLVARCYSDDKISVSISSLGLNEPLESFGRVVERCIYLVGRSNDKSSRYVASDIIPLMFYGKYESIVDLVLLKWIYNYRQVVIPATLSDFKIPEKLKNRIIYLVDALENIRNTTFIFNKDILTNVVQDVVYFNEIGVISPQDVKKLYDELNSMIRDMEDAAASGEVVPGRPVWMYTSNVSFDTSYTYLQDGHSESCMFKIYSVNSMDSQNPKVCDVQKKWIESLRLQSTLITRSGEYERSVFFDRQRKILQQLERFIK